MTGEEVTKAQELTHKLRDLSEDPNTLATVGNALGYNPDDLTKAISELRHYLNDTYKEVKHDKQRIETLQRYEKLAQRERDEYKERADQLDAENRTLKDSLKKEPQNLWMSARYLRRGIDKFLEQSSGVGLWLTEHAGEVKQLEQKRLAEDLNALDAWVQMMIDKCTGTISAVEW